MASDARLRSSDCDTFVQLAFTIRKAGKRDNLHTVRLDLVGPNPFADISWLYKMVRRPLKCRSDASMFLTWMQTCERRPKHYDCRRAQQETTVLDPVLLAGRFRLLDIRSRTLVTMKRVLR